VRPGEVMSLDLVAALVAAAGFIYLLWALLRPEDI
jgi:K+-transporting ATPase KdpF subunit